MADQDAPTKRRIDWKGLMPGKSRDEAAIRSNRSSTSAEEHGQNEKRPNKWSLGILNDRETDEVPGSILLLSKVSDYNEPLGLRSAPARTSMSSLHSAGLASPRGSFVQRMRRRPSLEKKRTSDGKFVLEPQPSDSANDPLNWPVIRRDLALLSLGFYCMVGGGMTPILAAGFSDVADDLDVTVPDIALTTGLYMMGLGLGSVVLSPTAILYGKRPVYLCASFCFVLSSVWCALSPSFPSLVVARIFQGFAVSSVECLPSATIAEIYFLHEKAYRLGIYTLLLLGGKNLVPLVSAAIIQSLGWRWVFWIVAIIVGFAGCLLFLFVPETFWDRAPEPHRQGRKRSIGNLHIFRGMSTHSGHSGKVAETEKRQDSTIAERRAAKRHAHFQVDEEAPEVKDEKNVSKDDLSKDGGTEHYAAGSVEQQEATQGTSAIEQLGPKNEQAADTEVPHRVQAQEPPSATSQHFDTSSPISPTSPDFAARPPMDRQASERPSVHSHVSDPENHPHPTESPKTYIQSLKPFSGRLSSDNWFRVALRPFILFAYPSILWSSLVYALSIGWLIVISESIAHIYEARDTYNFTPLQVGLVYISAFIGGVLGTAVAGKVSDLIVRYMARKNGGIYEPEYRLVMAIPIAITTVIGLMGFGWSAEERDNFMVPTVFFGIISFGCALGSTTSITFAVDSYRQYAGEALVTLNVSKNILHGLVWSLFFPRWLQDDGSKKVFVAIGGIQLACMLTTIPMYIWGKRGRMWTVRRNLMEKF